MCVLLYTLSSTATSMLLPLRFMLTHWHRASYAPPPAISCFSSAVGFSVSSSVVISSIHQPSLLPMFTVAVSAFSSNVRVVSFSSTVLVCSGLIGFWGSLSSFEHAVKQITAMSINISFFISYKFNRLILCNDFNLLDVGVYYFPIGFKVYVLYV